LAVGARDQMATAAARSHLSDGRCVGWFPAVRPALAAVDAEIVTDPPLALVARYGHADFWERWTRAETAAKLVDEPIVVWLRAHGLTDPDPGTFALSTSRHGSLVVTTGWLR
jgi:hypothetical protein